MDDERIAARAKRPRPKVRLKFSEKGLQFDGVEDIYLVYLKKLTGKEATWECRIAGKIRRFSFIWNEAWLELKHEYEPVRIANDLYALLYAVSMQLVQAAFAGYGSERSSFVHDARQFELGPEIFAAPQRKRAPH